MKILALEKEVSGVTDDQFTEEILEAKARKAWELYESDIFRELYFTADTNEAALLLECEGADEARRHLRAGLIDFDERPLKPYPGFARLFRNNGRQLMNDFPDFMKNPANRIATTSQATPGVEGTCLMVQMEAGWRSGRATKPLPLPPTFTSSTNT